MLDFQDDASRREKCYTTIAQLPAFVDPKQPPTKKSPFNTILGHPFVHTVKVILPEDAYTHIQSSLKEKVPNPRYARVFMPLSSLLEGDFFNTYIKSGNILMISEGRSGSDEVFSLRDGILRLELGKESFERTGLTGKPIRSGGRKHAKERYMVEINLRLPSMLHGKKGFERIVWAFKNVLNQSVSWLFCDLAPDSASTKEGGNTPLEAHHPQIVECNPIHSSHRHVLVPPFQEDLAKSSAGDLQDYCGEISDWLAMVALDSPRVLANDAIDPYLSRYAVPGMTDEPQASDLVCLKWNGLVPSQWILQLFVSLLRETTSSPTWFALSTSALGRDAVEGKDGYAVLTLPSSSRALNARGNSAGDEQFDDGLHASRGGRESVCWEFIGASLLLT